MIKLVPNILTVLRLVLSILLLALIIYAPTVQTQSPEKFSRFVDYLFVLFVFTALTDIVDGKIARKYNASSKFGRIMDPLVDKVLVCGTFFCFAIVGWPKLFGLGSCWLSVIQWSVAMLITLREVVVTVVRQIAESRGVNFAATKAGKMKMLVQSFTIGTIFVKIAHVHDAAWGNWFTAFALACTVVITIASGLPAVMRKDWRS